MAGSTGPDIIQSGLVLALDAADRNSCGGQPTTNLLTYSNALNNAIWVGYCGSTSNITYNTTDITDPIGTNTAIKIARNNVAVCGGVGNVAWGLLYAPASNILTAGKTYTVSIYARGAVGGESLGFGLNDSHTTFITLSTTWTRYSYTFTNITGVDRGFQFLNSTATSQVYYVWGPQTQEGSVIGPYAASDASNGTANLNWIDLSGNANNGTLTNAPSFSNSNLGTITLDGISNYVNLGNASSIKMGTGNFTINVWVKILTQTGTATYKLIITSKQAPAAAAGYGFAWNNSVNKFLWSTANGSISSEIFTTNTWSNLVNTWANIVMVRQNGATNNGHFYINGVYESLSSAATVLNVDTATNMTIGNTSDFYSPYWFKGTFGSVQIYNRALTASEILQNYNVTKTRFGL